MDLSLWFLRGNAAVQAAGERFIGLGAATKQERILTMKMQMFGCALAAMAVTGAPVS